ncbi:hypothetical protein [Levilactobacillus brevis]|uniref:hypothetical protein n=1 Tax=Levilactobacillus brevis TaxID=1580 RepID=UPI0003F74323|nr:hypothetical protein [Levilactobacillus brevis]
MRTKIDLTTFEKKADEAQKILEEKKTELAVNIGRNLMDKQGFRSWREYTTWYAHMTQRTKVSDGISGEKDAKSE